MSEYIVQTKKTVEEQHAIINELCEWISNGRTTTDFCKTKKIGHTALYRYIENSPDSLKGSLARAKELGFDTIADDMLAIADNAPERDIFGKIDAGDVAHRKLQIWTRQQLLSKWAPKKYGDKQQVEHSGGLSLLDAHAQGLLDNKD